MKTPQIPAMAGMTPLGYKILDHRPGCVCYECKNKGPKFRLLNPLATDQKTVAERKWRAGLKPSSPQQACDVGLFSDDSKQTELF